LIWLDVIGMWLISESIDSHEELEGEIKSQENTFLLKSLAYFSGKRVAKLHFMPTPSLIVKFPSHEVYHFYPCSNCNKMALAKAEFNRETKGRVLVNEKCFHCANIEPESIPDLRQIKKEIQVLENPKATPEEKLSLTSYIMAIGILRNLVSQHPNYKKPIADLLYGDEDIVAARLIVAQMILNKGLNAQITMDQLVRRVSLWTRNQNMVNYTRQSSQLWTKRGWIKRIKRDHYVVILDFNELT